MLRKLKHKNIRLGAMFHLLAKTDRSIPRDSQVNLCRQ